MAHLRMTQKRREDLTINNKQRHENWKHSIRLRAPEKADWYIDCFYYKMGLKGFVFYWSCGEWFKSSVTIKDIFSDLRSEDKKCFSINAKAKGEIS